MDRRIIVLALLLIAASTQDWQFYREGPVSNWQDHQYSFDLEVGDSLVFTIGANPVWNGYQNFAVLIMSLNGEYYGLEFVQGFGSTSDPKIIAEGQAGTYTYFMTGITAPVFYTLNVQVNGISVVSGSGLTGESIWLTSTNFFFTLSLDAVYRYVRKQPYLNSDFSISYMIPQTQSLERMSFTAGDANYTAPFVQLQPNQINSLFYQTAQGEFQGYYNFINSITGSVFDIWIDLDSIVCPEGSNLDRQAIQCVTCSEGQIWNGVTCVQCLIDTWTSGVANEAGTECLCVAAEDFFVPELSSCCPANSGFVDGASGCVCDAGFAWNVQISLCIQCPSNKFTTGISSPEGGCECTTAGNVWSVIDFSCVTPGKLRSYEVRNPNGLP